MGREAKTEVSICLDTASFQELSTSHFSLQHLHGSHCLGFLYMLDLQGCVDLSINKFRVAVSKISLVLRMLIKFENA